MIKVFIGLTVFVWAFYSHASDCHIIKSKVGNQSDLYQELNTKSPRLINEQFERAKSIDQVYISQQCTDKLIIRYQTAVKNLETGKANSKKFFCLAEVNSKTNDIIKASCLAARKSSEIVWDYDAPTAYPYGDVEDPFSGYNSNSGPSYGDEDPDSPSRNDDGPDSTNIVLF